MNLIKSFAAIAVTFTLAGAAAAQDNNTADEAFPIDPAAAANAAPKEVVKATHGAWEIRCTTAVPEQCAMYQMLSDAQGRPVVELTLIKLPAGSQAMAGVTAVTPLGTLLTNGLSFRIDEGQGRKYPYGWCTPDGCFARFGLDAPSIDGMKAGKAGQVAVFSISNPRQPILVNLVLDGFTAAFEELPEAPVSQAAEAVPPAPVVESPVTGQ